MPLILLKLVLTPPLIGGASLVARRWGPVIGGWVISLPLTSGPVTLFLALDRGTDFAATAATAALAGNLAIVASCLVFAWMATGAVDGRDTADARTTWPFPLVVAAVSWAIVAFGLQAALGLPVGFLAVLVLAGVVAGGSLMPNERAGVVGPAAPAPRWDVPLRIVVGTSVVVFLTAAAPLLGASLSGLLAMLPVIGAILTVFAYHRDGPANAVGVLRGIMRGLVGTAAFLAMLAATIDRLGIPASFAAAIATVLVLQLVTLRMLSRPTHALARQPVEGEPLP